MRFSVQGIRDRKEVRVPTNHQEGKTMRGCSELFSIPNQSQDVVESNGSKAIIALFNAYQKDSLNWHVLSTICSAKKVARAKMFVTA